MSSITNVNNNSSIVTVGRTTPVSPGQQPAEKSIPVVLASDQTPVPVEEQNKVQSEVALSLLGIPRAEVALGIFADVNTYDVNPSEWSSAPEFYLAGHGIKHLPNEAGALVEAPRNKTAVLTSKRFFRYQPGRVSAATFGIKATISASDFAKNPVIRKYGIFDNFDGYYWEVRNSGVQDNFSAIRRTQSVSRAPSTAYGVAGQTIKRGPINNPQGGDPIYVDVTQTDDYRFCGQGEKEIVTSPNLSIRDRDVLAEYRYLLADKVYEAVEAAYQGNSYSSLTDATGGADFSGTGAVNTTTTLDGTAVSNFYYDLARGIYGPANITNDAAGLAKVLLVKDKCKRDFDYWIDFFLLDLEWGGTAHTVWNLSNFTTALIPNYTEFEGLVYAKLLDAVQESPADAIFDIDFKDAFDISTEAHTKLASYVVIIANNLEAASNHYTTPVNWTGISGFDYGSKGAIDTFYDVKRNYWGYFVSVFKDTPALIASNPFAGAPLDWTTVANPYTNNELAVYQKPDGLGGFVTVVDDTEVVYTSSYGKEFTLADIKYKCQRDIAEYVATGFKNDISGGGNSQTKYNMSMYYQGSGLSVGSQGVNEKERHEYLSKIIDFDLYDKLGYATSQATRITQTSLSKKVVDNFDDENVETLISGVRGFAGNLIALRDGLLMVHAGVYDPNLLKEKKKIRVECSTDNRLKLTSGTVTIGQHVRFAQAGANVATIGDLEPGKLYRVASVIGPKGNEFTLETVTGYGEDFGNNSGYDFTEGGVNNNISPVVFTVANFDAAEDNGGAPENIYFETVVPFMMPDQPTSIAVGDNEEILYGSYDPAVYRNESFLARVGSSVTTITAENDQFPQGMMFPYMYSSGTGMPVKVTEKGTNLYLGYVNTALDTTTNAELEELRDQIDVVNFIPEYINWVKNNVKPEYWGVYEYRVPRSRYSFDKLDGVSGQTANHTGRLYSDVATGDVGIVRPGQIYAPGGEWQSADSVYSFDFTKVTMLKIEFSWYGAVGALFLAYVPVDNGEARWVRVHHLRASNQLKIASLGNATLPITYNVYGGGDSRTLGDGEEAITPAGANYETTSHNIVKYGASYYIDGGDRGTVRLYSHNNESLVASKGKIWDVGTYGITGSGSTFTLGSWSGTPKDDVNSTFFMGALLKTDSPADQNIRVVYTNDLDAGAGGTVTFSSPPAGSTGSFQLLVDRAAMTYGLEAKKVILSTQEGNAVRNRVQVYPTKMSTANGGNNVVRLRMKKTPTFQTTAVTSGTLQLSSAYVITSENLPLAVTESAAPYLKNGEAVYGWFRGIIDETSAISVFGRLYKEANLYYFDAQTTASGIIVLDASSNFLADRKFDYLGTEYSGVTRGEEEKEGLSSVLIITDPVVPIPGTGTNVATLYLQQGTEQFDLAAYFDYNKEYLSFPLTDNTESLYLAVDSDQLVDDPADNISIGITWEEQ